MYVCMYVYIYIYIYMNIYDTHIYAYMRMCIMSICMDTCMTSQSHQVNAHVFPLPCLHECMHIRIQQTHNTTCVHVPVLYVPLHSFYIFRRCRKFHLYFEQLLVSIHVHHELLCLLKLAFSAPIPTKQDITCMSSTHMQNFVLSKT